MARAHEKIGAFTLLSAQVLRRQVERHFSIRCPVKKGWPRLLGSLRYPACWCQRAASSSMPNAMAYIAARYCSSAAVCIRRQMHPDVVPVTTVHAVAVDTDFTPAKFIHHHHDDVWLVLGESEDWRAEHLKQCKKLLHDPPKERNYYETSSSISDR